MKKNNKKGFTLVELVIVVAVMAILVDVAIPTIGSIRTSAQNSVDESNAKTIESLIKLAESEQKTDGNIGEDAALEAVAEGKLGIKSKVFVYYPEVGKCYKQGATGVPTGDDAADAITITFNDDGTVDGVDEDGE